MPYERTLGSMFDVAVARTVVIHDAWEGLSFHAPILAAYDLHRTTSGSFAGTGHLSTRLAGQKAIRLTIAAPEMGKFLEELASARMTPGAYEPHIDHTDDFPHIEIAVHVGKRPVGRAGILLLFTRSQGEFHHPWGALLRGETFSVAGTEVGRALGRLARSLKRHVLDRMIRESPSFPDRVMVDE